MADVRNLGKLGSHLHNFRLGTSGLLTERDRESFSGTRGDSLRTVGRVFPLGFDA